ncbi:hypothetical protein AMECASPLE_025099, partial [Ameca splendens]
IDKRSRILSHSTIFRTRLFSLPGGSKQSKMPVPSASRSGLPPPLNNPHQNGPLFLSVSELRLDDGQFQRYFHLSRTQFEDLLSRVGIRIGLRDNNYQRCIPVAERLSICLRGLCGVVATLSPGPSDIICCIFIFCISSVTHCICSTFKGFAAECSSYTSRNSSSYGSHFHDSSGSRVCSSSSAFVHRSRVGGFPVHSRSSCSLIHSSSKIHALFCDSSS